MTINTDAREPDPHEAQSLAVARARADLAECVFTVLVEQSHAGVDLPEGFATRVAEVVARRATQALERLAFQSFTIGVDRGESLAAEEASLDAAEVAAG